MKQEVKQKLLNNFNNKEDKIIFSNILDNILLIEKRKEIIFTDFFDPIKTSKFMKLIINLNIVNVKNFGGYLEAERQILCFYSDDNIINEKDFLIDKIIISYDNRFRKDLEHRQFLGSILALGIDRGKVGDIIVFEKEAIVFVKNDMSEYIIANLEKVGSAKVKCKIEDKNFNLHTKEKEEKKITISSLRLDNIIKGGFNISRGKANDLISSEKVFVNWESIVNNSFQIKENDIITLRGWGRIKLEKINGETKKGKISITIIKY